mmetsp:Transcript_1112/g.3901  ORF Transcript_1112/g.3901 Transcript_1112/m.3901 type:complete len:463 (-) Transcript_1112:77-1465(-)
MKGTQQDVLGRAAGRELVREQRQQPRNLRHALLHGRHVVSRNGVEVAHLDEVDPVLHLMLGLAVARPEVVQPLQLGLRVAPRYPAVGLPRGRGVAPHEVLVDVDVRDEGARLGGAAQRRLDLLPHSHVRRQRRRQHGHHQGEGRARAGVAPEPPAPMEVRLLELVVVRVYQLHGQDEVEGQAQLGHERRQAQHGDGEGVRHAADADGHGVALEDLEQNVREDQPDEGAHNQVRAPHDGVADGIPEANNRKHRRQRARERRHHRVPQPRNEGTEEAGEQGGHGLPQRQQHGEHERARDHHATEGVLQGLLAGDAAAGLGARVEVLPELALALHLGVALQQQLLRRDGRHLARRLVRQVETPRQRGGRLELRLGARVAALRLHVRCDDHLAQLRCAAARAHGPVGELGGFSRGFLADARQRGGAAGSMRVQRGAGGQGVLEGVSLLLLHLHLHLRARRRMPRWR